MEKSIDINTLQMLMKLVTPAPVAPVAPIAPLSYVPPEYSKGSENSIAMAKDIEYLRKSVDTIGIDIKKITDTHVTVADATQHIADDNKRHSEDDKKFDELFSKTNINQTAIEVMKGQFRISYIIFSGAIALSVLITHFWK